MDRNALTTYNGLMVHGTFLIIENWRDPDYGYNLCFYDTQIGVVTVLRRYCGPDLELAWEICHAKNRAMGITRTQTAELLSHLMGEAINTVVI